MNNIELEAARRFLFFSVAETSILSGGASERAWRNWESGARKVPADVIKNISLCIEYREGVVDMFDEAVGHLLNESETGEDVVPLIYYDSLDDYSTAFDNPMFWRPYCSAIAEIYASYENVKLVKFELLQYRAWLKTRKDSESMRAHWAASNFN